MKKLDIKIQELYSRKGKAEYRLQNEEDNEKINNLKSDLEEIEIDITKKKKWKYSITKDSAKLFREQFKEIYGIKFDSSIGQYIRSEFPDIPDTILSPAISELSFYKKDIWKAKTGKETIKTFKRGIPFNTRGRDLKFFEADGEFFINWVKDITFKIHFGEDRSNNREIINHILNGTYKVCDSKISYGEKIFLYLCIDIPEKSIKLHENKVLGVDLGLAVPAYISTNTGYFRKALGSADDFLKIRLQIQNRKEKIQKDVTIAKGGHGRNRKCKASDRFEIIEKNWVRTYNHKISKSIVEAAIKERCKTINLEFLKGYGENEKNSFILRNWSYYELQQFIEYKAKKVGINVAYVDPYHTSQTCSECGNYEEGQRIDQKTFKCKKCGFKVNADFNASRNIARSKEYVTEKKHCQYFKNKDKNLIIVN